MFTALQKNNACCDTDVWVVFNIKSYFILLYLSVHSKGYILLIKRLLSSTDVLLCDRLLVLLLLSSIRCLL